MKIIRGITIDVFAAELTANAPDLRENENEELAAFVTRALREITSASQITVDGLEGDMSAVNALRGEYMEQYSWAEITKGNLHFGRI